MNVREPVLYGSWYPKEPSKIDDFLSPFGKNAGVKSKAAVAPHAGWYYSGSIAAGSISCLERGADTVVIIGGHLPAGMPFLFAGEDAVRSPYGLMRIDRDFSDRLAEKLNGKNDRYEDNTVEVLVPMAHSFFPEAKLLWVRFPNDLSSYMAGKKLYETAKNLNRKIAVIGSTDLTHYGGNYGFSPKGRGRKALEWVKKTNDHLFIKAVLEGRPEDVIRCADENRSACSAGAVLGVMGYTEQAGGRAEMLEYGTSADRSGEHAPESFVGYASFVWK